MKKTKINGFSNFKKLINEKKNMDAYKNRIHLHLHVIYIDI